MTSAAITLTRASTMKKVFSAGNQVLCDVCMDCGVLNRLRGNPGDLAKQLPDE